MPASSLMPRHRQGSIRSALDPDQSLSQSPARIKRRGRNL